MCKLVHKTYINKGCFATVILYSLSFSQDVKPREVYTTDFMVDNTQMGFLGEYSQPLPGFRQYN